MAEIGSPVDAAFAKATASQGEVTETQNTDSKSPLTNLIIMKKTKSRLQISLFLCSLMISISQKSRSQIK